MIDWDKPIRRTDTRELLHFIGRGNHERYFVEDAASAFYILRRDGSLFSGSSPRFNVENVPEKVVRYLNIFNASDGGFSAGHFYKDSADAKAYQPGCARIKVKFEPGQFDE